jgi:hypothetical protein
MPDAVLPHDPAAACVSGPLRAVFGHVSADAPARASYPGRLPTKCGTRTRLCMGLGPRFGSGPRGLALCTGCLTRDEGQCLHRRLLSLVRTRKSRGRQAREAQAPGSSGFPIDPRDQRRTVQGLVLRTGCDTPDRGGRRSIEPARTTRESQTKRWRDRRSASD